MNQMHQKNWKFSNTCEIGYGWGKEVDLMIKPKIENEKTIDTISSMQE